MAQFDDRETLNTLLKDLFCSFDGDGSGENHPPDSSRTGKLKFGAEDQSSVRVISG